MADGTDPDLDLKVRTDIAITEARRLAARADALAAEARRLTAESGQTLTAMAYRLSERSGTGRQR